MLSIVAILAVRNEAAHMANALRGFFRSGIDCLVIDNESGDGTPEICRRPEFAAGLKGLYSLPFPGHFSLRQSLEAKEQLIRTIDADWVIHADADEVMASSRPGETLRTAIERADAAGFTAIDFDEFVFLPLEADYRPDYHPPQPIRSYYFFQPYAPRLVRAWKPSARLSNVHYGGHMLAGEDLRLSPERLVLRHYPFKDQAHAFRKYADRRFCPDEVADGFHHNRVTQPPDRFRFPSAERLCWLGDGADEALERRHPHKLHYWQWET
jgi:glycosyltransferase involved in cell wall biosynthesis